MGIRSWLWHLVKPDANGNLGTMTEVSNLIESGMRAYHGELAFWSCVRVIKTAVAMTYWRTDVKGKPVFEKEHYILNVQPNRNQSAPAFWEHLVSQLLLRNEVLVFEDPTARSKDVTPILIADSFTRQEIAISDWTFKDVVVGDKAFYDTFYMKDVMYIRLNDINIKRIVDSVTKGYEELLETSAKYYQSARGNKIALKDPNLKVGSDIDVGQQLLQKAEHWKKVLDSKNGIAFLESKEDFKPIETGDAETSRDMRSMIDDIYDFTANAFGIAPALIRGRVAGTGDALDYTLNFAVNPIVNQIAAELNAKRHTRDEYLEGTKIVPDTSMTASLSIHKIGTLAGQLISSGIFSVNEFRAKIKEPYIDEPWANEYHITKNYESAKAQAGKAGKDNEKDE